MGRKSREKAERRALGTSKFYRQISKESRNDASAMEYKTEGGQVLNVAKHIAKEEKYKNQEYREMMKRTLETYRAYKESLTEEQNG
jgi:hypothetical protein